MEAGVQVTLTLIHCTRAVYIQPVQTVHVHKYKLRMHGTERDGAASASRVKYNLEVEVRSLLRFRRSSRRAVGWLCEFARTRH